MRFSFVDRIIELVPNERIVACKTLIGNEDYLADHFPLFPVMPGVLMLEALSQTAFWFVTKSNDFATTNVVLREARNIKYAEFVQPGQSLEMIVSLMKKTEQQYKLKAGATVDGQTAVKAQLIVECLDPALEFVQDRELEQIRLKRFQAELNRLQEVSATGAD